MSRKIMVMTLASLLLASCSHPPSVAFLVNDDAALVELMRETVDEIERYGAVEVARTVNSDPSRASVRTFQGSGISVAVSSMPYAGRITVDIIESGETRDGSTLVSFVQSYCSVLKRLEVDADKVLIVADGFDVARIGGGCPYGIRQD